MMPLLRFLFLCLPSICIFYSFTFAQHSVLADGEWYKIGITQPGIHKIDAAFLQKAGLNMAAVNPKHIKLYGNGGGMLPQANNIPRPDDLAENAIYVAGENDNKFDNSDYILFYAQGPHAVTYDTNEKRFRHQTNLYSDTTFYFLTFDTSAGLRITDQESKTGTTQTITTFDDYFFHEKELTNRLAASEPQRAGSGREWYGEKFESTATTANIDFNIPGIVAGSRIEITSAVMAKAYVPTVFTLSTNNQNIGTQNIPALPANSTDPLDTYGIKGINKTDVFSINASTTGNTANFRMTVSYDRKGASNAAGYLNYLGVQLKRELKLYDKQTTFRYTGDASAQVADFLIGGASNQLRIWDITDPLHPANQIFTLDGSQAKFGAFVTVDSQFLLFSGDAFDAPVTIKKIPNQNLRALSTPELLIITPTLFLEQANRLADFRRNHDGLQVQVVTVTEIYNEFSSGRQDITAIRDFIRLLYKKSQSLQYILLVGDASYDYKNRLASNTNFVPIYESRESLHPIFSYSSDDYYGFMDDEEGEWPENNQGDHTMDLAVGRLPVKTVKEATDVVSKLIHYAQDQQTFGKWRSKVCFVADDGDNNTHQLDADRLAGQIAQKYPAYHTDKIFMDAFPQVSAPGRQTVPEVNQSINNAVDKGHLIINYTGHGGEIGWAEEQVLTIQQINAWENYTNLPLFVTATCEFGRYDDPVRTSGAEYILLNPKGGGIGLITTTRPVFSNTNYTLNVAFYNTIFEPVNGRMPRLGDAMKATKNNSLNGSINRNFALLGDPSMRLAYPQEEIVLTTINGKAITEVPDTIKALSKVTLAGNIQDFSSGELSADFNGIVYVTVYDKASQVTTLGNKGAKMNFSLQQNTIYEGKASVKNGRFQFSFIVPKDIDYRFDTGKISMYAKATDQARDASGALTTLLVGGSQASFPEDTTPPEIKLFMDDTTFVNGGITGSDTWLLAQLSDSSGINITQTGIGHALTATLNSAPDQIINLNEFYTAGTNSYQQGTINYPFKGLEAGKYTLTLKAWDTYNNSSQASLDFIVANSAGMALQQVVNFPNPFNQSTTFQFEHNQAGEDLEVTVEIFTYSGQLVHTVTMATPASTALWNEYSWDGRTNSGDKLSPGIYVYKLSVRSMADGANAYHLNKLVIIQ